MSNRARRNKRIFKDCVINNRNTLLSLKTELIEALKTARPLSYDNIYYHAPNNVKRITVDLYVIPDNTVVESEDSNE